MSRNAIFVQVEDQEIARLKVDPGSVEALFVERAPPTAGGLNMTASMQERFRTIGPHSKAAALPGGPRMEPRWAESTRLQ
jgi:hypothetical protein